MSQGGYDDRTPVTRVLDMIDLPRNVLANVLFRPTGVVDTEGARRGALGLPVVTTSDALKNLGVSNKVARGILGFVGDVALDPLTYLGPAGWGLEVMDNAGRAIGFGKAGAKGIRGGIKELSKGKVVSHAETRELIDVLIANAPDAVKNGDAAAKAAYLSKRTIGDIGPGSKAASPFYYLSRGLGGDARSRGGAIGELLAKEGAEGDAVRKFVSQFGTAAGPGIGKGGSQVAHIPLTGISAKVPGFTRAGRAAEYDLDLARSAAPRPLSELITPTIIESGKRAQNLEAFERNIRAATDFDANVRKTLEKQIEDSYRKGQVTETATLEAQLADHTKKYRDHINELKGQRNAEARLLQKLVEQKTAIPANITNPRELNVLRQHMEEADTASKLALARQAADANPILARKIQADASTHARNATAIWDRIAKMQTSDDPNVAARQYLLPDERGRPVIPADEALRQRVAEQARPLLDQIDDAEKELDSIKAVADVPEKDPLFAAAAIGQPAVDEATLAREADRGRALERLTGLRDQLESVVSQGRSSPGISIDDAREAAKEAHFNSIDKMEQSLARLADEDIFAAEQVAESTQATMAAYERHKAAVRGAVSEARKLTKDEDMMAQMMARFLGTDERVVGRAGLAGPEVMTRVPGGNRVSQVLDTVFGAKGTAVTEQARQMRHARNATWRRAVQNYVGSAVDETRKAFKAVGIKPTGDDMAEAASLMFAMTIARQVKLGEVEAGRAIVHTTKFGQPGVPSTMMEKLLNAKKTGKFSGVAYGDLVERLEKISATYGNELLAKLHDLELENGVLKAPRPGYFPNVMGRDARKAMNRGKRWAGDNTKRTQAAVREAFQKERSTDQARFISQRPGKEGQERRLFGFELDQAERIMENPGELAGLRAEGLNKEADALEELVADYREFLALPVKPRFLATDPFELREVQLEGAFSLLLDGVNPQGGFMETNMFSALGDRVGQHVRAMAREDFGRYIRQFAVTVPGFRGFVAEDGKTLRAVDGSEATLTTAIDSFGKEMPAAMIGGQKYRPISVKYKDQTDNPLIEMLGKEGTAPIYHEQVAGLIERSADVYSEENAQWFLKGLDTITREWKGITLLHPSWSIFNLIGDMSNAFTGGAELKNLFNPTTTRANIKAIWHAERPEELAKTKINILGQEVSLADHLANATDLRVVDGTMMQETFFGLNENKIMTMGAAARGDNSLQAFRPAAIDSDHKEMAQRFAAAKGREASRGDKAKAAWYVASDRYHENFLGPWSRINSKMSNFVRLQTYTSFLEQGYDMRAAAQKAIESQFDYADMTRIETEVFRRVLPFYAWMRNNGAFQVKKLFERPIYAASFPRLQAAIEEAIAGDEKVPLQNRPNWMRQALALQIGADPDKRMALLFGSSIPVADVYQYMAPVLGAEGIQSFLHYFSSGINPVLNLGLQIGAGQETFSGRTIGADATSGDITMGQLLRQQIRPLAEIPKIADAYGRSTGEGIARTFLGGRAQDFSEERITSMKKREYADAERGIRAAINKQERKGQSSVEARVKLMQLYAAMEQNGFGDSVPKWARAQIRQMETANG